MREFPRYNRFLTKAHETELTPAEAHVLVELDSAPKSIQKELGERVCLDKVTLSRLLSRLRQAGLLTSEAKSEDRRQQSLHLAPSGRKVLRSFDAQANANLITFCSVAGLSSPHIARLSLFLTNLADALCAPQSAARRHEHPLRAPIRRLTRMFGLIGAASLGSDLVVSEWQLLLTVAEHSGRLTPGALSELLGVDKTAIAATLRGLKQRSLIHKEKSDKDSRSELIHCTRQGYRLVFKIEEHAVRRFQPLSCLSPEEVLLVEQFIRGAAVDFFLHQRQLHVVPILEEKELQRVRRLTVGQFSSPQYVKSLPGSLFSARNSCFGLYQEGEVVAAIEIQRPTKSSVRPYLENLYSSDTLHPDTVRAFILVATKSTLTSRVDIEFGGHSDDLRPSAEVCSTLGALF